MYMFCYFYHMDWKTWR